MIMQHVQLHMSEHNIVKKVLSGHHFLPRKRKGSNKHSNELILTKK